MPQHRRSTHAVAIRDQVDAHIRDGHYEPYLGRDGMPGLRLTAKGARDNAPVPATEPKP